MPHSAPAPSSVAPPNVIAYTDNVDDRRRERAAMTLRPRLLLLALLLPAIAGCFADPAQPEVVWGKQGVADGDISRPRAIAIDSHDRLYIVDFTARIQVYDRD